MEFLNFNLFSLDAFLKICVFILIIYLLKCLTVGSKFSIFKHIIYFRTYWPWYEKNILNNEFQPTKKV